MLSLCSVIIKAGGKTQGINSSVQSLFEFLGIILIFIIVLVACWATTRFVASRQLVQKNMGNFEVMETYVIARDRFLQLVRIGTKYYAIAVGKDSINVISEIPVEDLNLEKKSNATVVSGFSGILASIVKKQHDGKES